MVDANARSAIKELEQKIIVPVWPTISADQGIYFTAHNAQKLAGDIHSQSAVSPHLTSLMGSWNCDEVTYDETDFTVGQ